MITVYVSGILLKHEVDAHRLIAKRAIENMGHMAIVPIGRREIRDASDAWKRIERVDAFIAIVAESYSRYVDDELMYALALGLPCRVFARKEDGRSSTLQDFLAHCCCQVDEFDPYGSGLAEGICAFVRSITEAGPDRDSVLVHTQALWQEMIRWFLSHPEAVYRLSPRRFEELIAEIISAFGYKTSLTPQTSDGGYDIVAERTDDPVFPGIHLIETKLWTPPRKVGRPVIQAIYGTGIAHRCNGVMVVTPTEFSRQAKQFVDEAHLRQYVRLVDGGILPSWYERYLSRNA